MSLQESIQFLRDNSASDIFHGSVLMSTETGLWRIGSPSVDVHAIQHTAISGNI